MIKIPENVLAELSAKYGTSPEKVEFIGGGREDSDGTVFTFSEGEAVKVLKILAIPKKELEGIVRLEERVRFANFLGENGIQLAYPETNVDGSLFHAVEAEKHIFTAYKMNLYEGYHPKQEELTGEFYNIWGRVTGKMHKITKAYPHWLIMPSGRDSSIPGWQEEVDMFYEWCKDEEVKIKWGEMRERLAKLPINRDTFGFIHNDNHVNNVLWNSKDITIIDFDVANCNFFMNDVVTPFQGMLFDVTGGMVSPIYDRDRFLSAMEHFLNGYEQENHLEDLWIGKIDTFISYRRLLLFTVMQGWLNTELGLKEKFKEFIKNEPEIWIK